MFQPGHLHISRQASAIKETVFSLDLYYELRHDAREGEMVHFKLNADIDGKTVKEEFDLHRDTACQFASVTSRIMARHGLAPMHGPVVQNHKDYDAMYDDLRTRLRLQPGEAIDLDHLQKDGL